MIDTRIIVCCSRKKIGGKCIMSQRETRKWERMERWKRKSRKEIIQWLPRAPERFHAKQITSSRKQASVGKSREKRIDKQTTRFPLAKHWQVLFLGFPALSYQSTVRSEGVLMIKSQLKQHVPHLEAPCIVSSDPVAEPINVRGNLVIQGLFSEGRDFLQSREKCLHKSIMQIGDPLQGAD